MAVDKLDAPEKDRGHNRTSQYLRHVSNLKVAAASEVSSTPTKTSFSQIAHDVKNCAIVTNRLGKRRVVKNAKRASSHCKYQCSIRRVHR
jgi:hypothetical protein